MINKNIFGFVVVAALSFGLVGCGDSNADTLDQILGGGEVNGCMGDSAMDLTGSTAVTITDIDAWDIPHSACIIVSQGTVVTWQGNFDTHPLVGGTSPLTDLGSPITQADASGTADAAVTFSAADRYPYFCDVHQTNMLGVVYVVP